ncbi:MAG: glycosyltransferase family 2 protein [Bacteroidales bacterium]|nr:glycosyltransferase family 2 protein [Bacteroidales bacterium]
MPKVSIIIPVHNSARYIEAALKSIFLQSHKDYEVLLVDDGSTDDSARILDSYGAAYDNVRVFHKPCGGVSSARNLALDNVSPDSRYIFFLDSDDLLYPDGLTKLVAAMESKPGAVMALGAIGLFSDNLTGETSSDSIVPDSIIPCINGGITSGECLDEYLHSRTTLTQKYLWNRIFRSDLIRHNHLRFDEKIHYKEDGLFVIQYLLCCIGPVVCLNELVYLYRQNPASAMGALNDMSKPWNPKIMTNLDAHGRILDELRYHRVSRRLILQEIHNTFGCRRWILRRVIGHRSGRRRASLTTLLKISRPVLTALF